MTTCAACGHESPEAFKFCPECGTPVAVAATTREVRKIVTIVFCDLTGSTALGDRTDPEALRATMRGYFEKMRIILERHGGTVEKFVGDAVMAVFGVPVSHEDDGLRAVRAAWEMRFAVTALGLQARIGVNTGEVVTGEGDTLVTGDAVNVAARLEQAAEPGEVLIGERTRQLVRDAAEVERVEVEAKGKPQPLTAFRIVALDLEASGFERRLDAPLVGRSRELGLLRQAFERSVSEQSCQLFTLLGPAGVGKSRLAAAFLETVDATVVRGRCLDYGEGITLWPVIEVLKQLQAHDTIERITGTLPATELFWSVRRRLEAAAAERPLALVFDDVHWGETTFLDLLDHISDLSRGVPILLLCLARPDLLDDRPDWAGGKLNATTTLLEPLSRDESAHLLASIGGDLNASTQSRILDAAAGNPLFVEEMLALSRDDGDIRAPSTVQALLQARLDRLPAAQRAVIERAAVEGEIFHRGSVAELSGEVVDTELAGLVRKELIRPERATFVDDDAYRFRHLLIRDAAYDALPKETRADLHERFARWLEHRGGLVELDEIVGYHLEQAALNRHDLGRSDVALARSAAERLRNAGRHAADREDLPAAENLLRRALALLPAEDDARISILQALASALIGSAMYDRLEEVIAALETSGNPGLQMHGRIARALVLMHAESASAGVGATARRTAEDAKDLFSSLGDQAGVAHAWMLLAMVQNLECQMEAMLVSLEQAVGQADRAGDLTLLGNAYGWMTGPLTHGPFTPSEVRARFVRRPDGTKSRFQTQAELMLEATLLRREGLFDDCHALWCEADGMLADLGLEVIRRGMWEIPAECLQARGELAEAERLYREAWNGLGELGETGFRSTLGLGYAEVIYARGRPEEAEELVRESQAMGGPDDLANHILGGALKAKIEADRGLYAESERLGRNAVRYALQTDMVTGRAYAFSALAHALRAAGQLDEARSLYDDALGEHESHGDVVLAARTRELLVEL